ncbi:MAG TPA: helix-turn-helix transcriptional regulator [Dehalococcoidia bacterium]|nr:helix-turn-helix transcriptional regulator [Dehalococcoidia bacterium]
MQDRRDTRIGKDLVAASAIPLVLAILEDGETYGYAILKRIEELSGGDLEWTDGMLYPLLHRLERLGYVEGRWASPDVGRRRHYYRITPNGQNALSEQRRQWEVVSEALHNALRSFQVLSPSSLPGAFEA